MNDQVKKRDIGMAIPWGLMRLLQMIVTAGIASMCAVMPIAVPIRILYFGAVIALSAAAGHPFARVAADSRGLYVTRYWQTHFLEWQDVISAELSLHEGGIKIRFRPGVSGLHYAIVTLPDMPVGRAFALLRKDQPEVVLWIREQIQAAKSGP